MDPMDLPNMRNETTPNHGIEYDLNELHNPYSKSKN